MLLDMELFSSVQKQSHSECVGIDQRNEVLKDDSDSSAVHMLW